MYTSYVLTFIYVSHVNNYCVPQIRSYLSPRSDFFQFGIIHIRKGFLVFLNNEYIGNIIRKWTANVQERNHNLKKIPSRILATIQSIINCQRDKIRSHDRIYILPPQSTPILYCHNIHYSDLHGMFCLSKNIADGIH